MSELATLNQLNRFVELARGMGFSIRQEILGGKGAAVCQVKGQPCLFLDLSSGPAEQLDAIREALGENLEDPTDT